MPSPLHTYLDLEGKGESSNIEFLSVVIRVFDVEVTLA
jgi:hypothetical protein